MDATTVLTGLGALIAAGGAFWTSSLELLPRIKPKKWRWLPAMVTLLGALLVIVGAVWGSVERARFEARIGEKSDEIIKLSKRLAEKSDEIAQLNQEIAAKSDRIALLSQEAAAAATGGDEFAFLEPYIDQANNRLFVIVEHRGKYPIYDLGFRFFDFRVGGTRPMIEEMLTNKIEVGNLAPRQIKFLAHRNFTHDSFNAFNAFFTARNQSGFVEQQLRYVKVNGVWKSATEVRRSSDNRLLYQRIDKDFPRNSKGQVDWNDARYSAR